jgi:hypothetical protein
LTDGGGHSRAFGECPVIDRSDGEASRSSARRRLYNRTFRDRTGFGYAVLEEPSAPSAQSSE